MVWNKKKLPFFVANLFVLLALTACSINYKFTGTSINYDVIKTIQINNMPIRSAYVWAPMEAIFYNKLQDMYVNQTRLHQVKKNGDLQISGEIVGYDQFNKAISANGYSSQTQLKMTINVRFVNNKNHTQDFERQFTATTQYESSQQLATVQEQLVTEMSKDLAEQIFNATVANW